MNAFLWCLLFAFLHQQLLLCSFTQHNHPPKQFCCAWHRAGLPGTLAQHSLDLFPGWVHELGQTKVPALVERSGCAPGQRSQGCSSLLGGDLGTWPGSSPAGKSFQGHRQPVVAVWAPFLRERSWNSLSCVVYLHLLLLCLLVWHFPLVLCLTSQFLMFLSQPEWQIPVPDLQPLLLGFGDLGPLSVQNSPVFPQVRTECCDSYFAIYYKIIPHRMSYRGHFPKWDVDPAFLLNEAVCFPSGLLL